MRIFYSDEGPIETLLQIAAGPVRDGDLVSKQARDAFAERGWVVWYYGFNIISPEGESVVRALKLCRPRGATEEAAGMFTGGDTASTNAGAPPVGDVIGALRMPLSAGQRWRDTVTGEVVTEIARPMLWLGAEHGCPAAQAIRIVIYRKDSGPILVRPGKEFEDRRFERIVDR